MGGWRTCVGGRIIYIDRSGGDGDKEKMMERIGRDDRELFSPKELIAEIWRQKVVREWGIPIRRETGRLMAKGRRILREELAEMGKFPVPRNTIP